MSTIFPYVSPEQAMRGKAEYAQKGIAKGRTSLAVTYTGGVALIAQNSSAGLYKTSEIHDRIGFIAVGKYDEFEALRVAGIRMANMRAWQYSRQDVQAVSLVRAFASTMSQAFTTNLKPLEVELILAELKTDGPSVLYRIRYDGAIQESRTYLAIGGNAQKVTEQMKDVELQPLHTTIRRAALALGHESTEGTGLEVAILTPTEPPLTRCFTRLSPDDVTELLQRK